MPLQALYDLPAPAKLNRFLHVVGRRADGYHLLQSVFVLIDWADHLHLERRSDGRLIRHDLSAALPADDLCLRAARALQSASGCGLGVDISINKQLPWGAGLGGGSSDAATTLLALNRLWSLNWPRARLAQIGLALGADVHFFIAGRSAFVEGIGERLTAMRVPPSRYAVVKPPTAIPTRDIFEHPLLARNTGTVIVTGSPDDAGNDSGAVSKVIGWPTDWAADFGKNDLQPAAQDRCPDVAQAAAWLQSRYGNGRMTGSGSAVFATVSEGNDKNDGTAKTPMATFPLDELPAGWVGRMCRGLDEHPLLGWASD